MAYRDSQPDALLPAPMTATAPAVAALATSTVENVPGLSKGWRDARGAQAFILGLIGGLLTGLVFALAITAVGDITIACVITLLALLPVASLVVVPSRTGR